MALHSPYLPTYTNKSLNLHFVQPQQLAQGSSSHSYSYSYSTYHPFHVWFIFNVCIAVGLWISALTVTKAYVIMEMGQSSSPFSFSFIVLFCYLLGVFYPILWGFLFYNSRGDQRQTHTQKVYAASIMRQGRDGVDSVAAGSTTVLWSFLTIIIHYFTLFSGIFLYL